MGTTGRYQLPLIMPQQAQKHITHNEAITLLDGMICPVVKSFGSNTPPSSPLTDDAHFTGSNPTGVWFDEPNRIAFNTDAGWRFVLPKKGLSVQDEVSGKLVIFDGATWQPFGSMIDMANLPQVGINTSADATNRLAVRSNAALFTALFSANGGTGDIQLKLNKEVTADTGTLLFQTGWSGRAEMGLAGDDDYTIKVSTDGAIWKEAVRISSATGLVTLTPRSISNLALANMASARVKGRSSSGTGAVEDLTGAQVAALLPVFSTTLSGIVPSSPGGSLAFLCADGTWSEPDASSGPKRFYTFNDCVSVTNAQDWTFLVTGTGAAHSVSAFGIVNSIGAALGALGTTATGRCSISSPAFTYLQLGVGETRFKTRLKLSTLSDATNTWALRAGLLDSVSSESTDGVFFRYTHSTAAGQLQAVCRSNNVETVVDSGLIATTTATYVLDIFVNAAGTSAEFRINGSVVATIATNIPTGVGREVGYGLCAIRSAGTVALNAYLVDYLLTDVRFTAAR